MRSMEPKDAQALAALIQGRSILPPHTAVEAVSLGAAYDVEMRRRQKDLVEALLPELSVALGLSAGFSFTMGRADFEAGGGAAS